MVDGYVKATTPKAVLLAGDGFERWFPLRYCRVIGGQIARGEWVAISVPGWILEKEQSTYPARPAAVGAGVPPDMLKRLIQLCHPDKHGGSKASTVATEWLLSLRG